MYQNTAIPTTTTQSSCMNQKEILGDIVSEILNNGHSLNRKSLCTKLLSRLDQATNEAEKDNYNKLICLLFL